MLYLPGGRLGRVYFPCPSLFAERDTPLPVATTVAPGTTAEEGSVTVPRTEPTFWACATWGIALIAANTASGSNPFKNFVHTFVFILIYLDPSPLRRQGNSIVTCFDYCRT